MERFGRYAFVLVLIASAAIIIFVGPSGTPGSATQPNQQTTPTVPARPTKVFTRAELAKYDGRNGQPAYVAVDGFVYDVTGSRFFANGVHSVCEEDTTAGQDLSEELAEAATEDDAPPGMREMLAALYDRGHDGGV